MPPRKSPHVPSETYLLLKSARAQHRTIEAFYEDHLRTFEVRLLGHTHGLERCHAYQYLPHIPGHEAGWRCFTVSELQEVQLGPPLSDFPYQDKQEPPDRQNCVREPDYEP